MNENIHWFMSCVYWNPVKVLTSFNWLQLLQQYQLKAVAVSGMAWINTLDGQFNQNYQLTRYAWWIIWRPSCKGLWRIVTIVNKNFYNGITAINWWFSWEILALLWCMTNWFIKHTSLCAGKFVPMVEIYVLYGEWKHLKCSVLLRFAPRMDLANI